jgi:hypothetical protein
LNGFLSRPTLIGAISGWTWAWAWDCVLGSDFLGQYRDKSTGPLQLLMNSTIVDNLLSKSFLTKLRKFPSAVTQRIEISKMFYQFAS